MSIFGHFLTVNNCRYGRCYVKIIIPPCTFLEFYTQLEANSAKSFQSAFEDHCSNISGDILNSVFYRFGGTIYDFITFLICIIQKHEYL